MVAYLPAFAAGFIWDDDRYVTHNVLLRSAAGLGAMWRDPRAMLQYYPLTHSTLWLEYQLWGLWAPGYHAVNVVLHGLGAVVLWRLLARLAVRGAWLAAAIFALHPVHVESVAWVSEVKNVQSGFFYLLAALAWVHFVLDGTHRRGWYALALAAFICALLSKTVTCTLPAALLVGSWWLRGRLGRADVLPLVPFFAVGLAAGLATPWFERQYVGAGGTDWGLSLADRLLVAGRALWFYAGKLAWPARLTFVYPRWTLDAAVWWQWLFPLAAVAVVAALWLLRARIGRGPAAAVAFFGLTLAPALGFFDVYPMRFSFVADHFQYLASIGLITLAAAGLARWRRLVAAPLLVLLGILTWRQTHAYAGLEALWRDTLAKNPAAWLAHVNLGRLLLDRGQVAEARQHLEATLALRPSSVEALYNLGNLAVAGGRLAEARRYYEEALRADPHFAPAHNNLGTILVNQGRLAEGIAHFEKALELTPDYPDARANLNAARALLDTR